MKKVLVPALCLLHMAAILWWTLPHSFAGMVLADPEQAQWEARLFNWFTLSDNSWLNRFFLGYIDVTGSQQYWDFFAPKSPLFHQYLSVCHSINAYPEQGKLACKGKALFSNLHGDSSEFKHFGPDNSRLYRLTENLTRLEEPRLLEAFTHYYLTHQKTPFSNNGTAQLVLHQFELHPELTDLPKSGYRMDKLLGICH
jgi:hypothetical protein